jgi:hypothetical protein
MSVPYHFPSSHSQTPSGSQTQTPSHSYTHSHLNEYFTQRQQQHASATSSNSLTGVTSAPHATPGSSEAQLSPGLLPATSRYEETAFYRAELDSVKRENDALKRRVRELERMVRDRRASDASRASTTGGHPRTRSESVSTTASVSVAASATGGGGTTIAGQREPGSGAGGGRGDRPRVVSMLSNAGSEAVGVPEELIKVGESAASLREEQDGQAHV